MKHTGKVEWAVGSLMPNARGLWYTSYEKLNEASVGLEQMKEAKDRVSYESGWVRFVESLEESWSSFWEEGVKLSTKFQPWAGRVEKQRKSDDLLRYLIQSRHQSQHGNIAIDWEEGSIKIAPNYFGHIKDLIIREDGSFEVEANPLGTSYNQVTLEHCTGNPRLPVVTNRKYKQTYTPPKSHLGEDLGSLLPHELGEKAIQFYRDKYGTAIQLFGGQA